MAAKHESEGTVSLPIALPLLATAVLLAGCTSELGVLECQQLSEETVQYVDLPMDAESVWQAVCAKVGGDPACRGLSRSNGDHLVSWCESVESWRDFGQDALLIAQTPPLSGLASQRGQEKQVRKNLQKMVRPGIGITTVWVQPLGSGCRVNIRRTYYGPGSAAGLGHSRGDYERDLLNGIAGRRGTWQTGKSVSSEGAVP